MKKIVLSLAVMVSVMASCKPKYASQCELKSDLDSVSYALGYFEGKGLSDMMHRMPFDTVDVATFAKSFENSKFTEQYAKMRSEQFDSINYDAFMYGFTHQLRYRKGLMEEARADAILNVKFQAVREAKKAAAEKIAEENEAIGREFLAKNAENDSVVALESGVQYKVLVEGTGKVPEAKQHVKVNYSGRLIDGTEFDSSYKRNEPFRCSTSGGVIEGWQEVLKMMPVGSKWEVYIPSDKAYGRREMGEIKPGSTLIFTIELLEIEDKKK